MTRLRLPGLLICASALLSPAAPAVAQRDPILPVPLRPIVDEFYRSCELTTATGLGYSVLHRGKGRLPRLDDVVVVDYLLYSKQSGEIFDEGVATPMLMSSLIEGVAEGLQLVPAGSVVRLCVPARLAYGDRSHGPVPADTDLVFQFELREVLTRREFEKRAAEAQRNRD